MCQFGYCLAFVVKLTFTVNESVWRKVNFKCLGQSSVVKGRSNNKCSKILHSEEFFDFGESLLMTIISNHYGTEEKCFVSLTLTYAHM